MNRLKYAIAVALICFAAIVGMSFILNDSTPKQEPVYNTATYSLTLDASNAALMHKYGLPTKADVMQYHVHGQWGFFLGGTLYAYDRLPGDSKAWDEMYEIDSNNPAFDK